jgi:hypothetical protein
MADQIPSNGQPRIEDVVYLSSSHTKIKAPILRLRIRQHSRGLCDVKKAVRAAFDHLEQSQNSENLIYRR